MLRIEEIVRSSALATLCMLTACSTAPTLVDSPSVSLTRIQPSRMSFDRQTFVLGFDIRNPNAFPLPVKSIRYRIQIANQRFASGETQGEFTVPADGASSFAISVDLDMLQQTSRLAPFMGVTARGDVEYQLDGSLTVNIPLTKAIPFSNKGTISLSDRP